MFSALSVGRRDADAWRGRPRAQLIWTVYGSLGVVLVAYIVSLIIRGPTHFSQLVDGWMVVAFELTAASLCITCGLIRQRDRTMPLVLGVALLSWTVGDLLLNFESLGGTIPSIPSPADAFYLAFYPLAYVGLVITVRREVRRMFPATWLDGAVAGLGAAAVCACFAFDSILHQVGGSPMGVATNLAFPIGDLLLLALVFGGSATFLGWPSPQWLLLGFSCAIVAVGDTFNLLQTSGSTSALGTVLNGVAWPTAILLISASMWLRPSPTTLWAVPRTPGFLLPGLGAVSALGILFVGTREQLGGIPLALAAATLITVGLRLTMSVRRLRALTDERQHQSVTDDLTELGNRRQLFSLFDAYFADRASTGALEQQLAFLFVDLDHFKEINDSFGHSAGDLLLRQLGPRLREALRSSDALVRLGGDEFGVVILNGEPDYAATVARRLLARLEEPFRLDNAVSVRISASIGIARAPSDASDGAGLLRCADLAMYRAKLRESNFEFYRKDIDDDGNRLQLVEELTHAVESGNFVLHYQPQLDLRTGEISSVEALIRWPHPRLGLVPPLDFLPLAEGAGLMNSLTEVVLDQALAQCAVWRLGGRTLGVSVNVSVSNLLHPEFVDMVHGRLSHHRVPASTLTLEITETSLIRDFAACQAVIATLRDLGIAVSIDDFGAGFTSLAYLGDLAASELKLDITFITRLTSQRAQDLALVRATIQLAHTLGLRVVAEGIEDGVTLDLLTGVGCDLAQGYFIGRPIPADQLATAVALDGHRLAIAELAAS